MTDQISKRNNPVMSGGIKKVTHTSRYTNAGLKVSLYVCAHTKIIPWKFPILNP